MLTLVLRVLFAGVLATFICGVQGFTWENFPEDGAIVYSCSGQKVSMLWRFTTDRDESYDIHWTFDGLFTTELIGSFTHDQFLPNPLYSDRVRHLENGGLSFSDLSGSDTGNYTVEVNIQNAMNVVTSYRRQIFLQVTDGLMLRGQSLQAKQEPVALWDAERGQWVIQLTCGTFTFIDQPTIDVTWTTPSGESRPSSSYNDGNFFLTLTSPVQGGNYSCHIPQHLLPDVCGTATREVRASVHVVELTTRLSLIEAEQRTLKEDNRKLQEESEKLKEENKKLQVELNEKLKEEDEKLQAELNEKLKQEDEKLQAELIEKLKEENKKLQAELNEKLKEEDKKLQVELNEKLKEEDEKLNEKMNEKVQAEVQKLTEIHRQDVAGLKQHVKEEKEEIMQDIQRVEDIHMTDNVTLRDSIQRLGQMMTKDCLDVKLLAEESGVRTITVKRKVQIDVYCDQTTDGGGWTVIQKRQDGSVNFNRNWADYETGFGDKSGEYWIGLANLHSLTSNGLYSLRVDLEDFDGTTAYAVYNSFSVSGPGNKYTLSVSGYGGTAGDSLHYHNNQKFSTPDSDNDQHSSIHCADRHKGGWWFQSCDYSHLNGEYKEGGGVHGGGDDGIVWYHWHSDSRSYKRAEMKIRPRQT